MVPMNGRPNRAKGCLRRERVKEELRGGGQRVGGRCAEAGAWQCRAGARWDAVRGVSLYISSRRVESDTVLPTDP